ncbi:hypothetical protein ABK040_009034 [Willaertia magna]
MSSNEMDHIVVNNFEKNFENLINKFHIHQGGFCKHHEYITNPLQKDKNKIIEFPSLFFYIKHVKYGNILFDTGYSNSFFKETKSFPFYFYGQLTPVTLHQMESAKDQLFNKYGIKSEEINFIIISHFHADHISGCCDFPKATFIYSKSGYEYLQKRKNSCICSNVQCCMNGFIPNLLPKDFLKRSKSILDNEFQINKSLPFLTFDLFGDKSIYIVNLPGHCKGHLGIYFYFNKNYHFLIGDAAWSTMAIKENILPHIFTKFLVQNDWTEYKQTLNQLHLLYHHYQQEQLQENNDAKDEVENKRKGILIYPSHCQEIAKLAESIENIKLSKL